MLVLAHGAGAGMTHAFMEALAGLMNDRGIGVIRFNFPYTEQGKRAPNSQPILLDTARAVVEFARKTYPEASLFYGGKSMGGRMGSIAASKQLIPGIRGLAFFGFPLHAPGRDSVDRAKHLAGINVPMLFHQGTRDKLANIEMITSVCESLGSHATLFIYEGADHSFNTRKKDPHTKDEVMEQIADNTARWMAST